MKHLFILNPVAGGNSHNFRKTAETINKTMLNEQGEYEIYITEYPMDASRKIKEDAQTGEELRVYACGGDGTLNECVNGAVGFPNVSITHFPCGTGNDFIKTFGADKEKFFDLPALINGQKRKVDIINCNGRYSINICSVGIDARIGTDVHKYSRIPLIGGATGYVVALIVNFFKGISDKLTIITENSTLSGEYALVCACNGRYYGGGFNPVPDAVPNDGVINFLIINKVSRLKIIKLLGKYASGRYREIGDTVIPVSGKRMMIESEKACVVNVDGEAIYGKKILFEMVHNGISFIFPNNMDCNTVLEPETEN